MKYGIIRHIDVHLHAKADLTALWVSDPEAAAIVHVTLEQLEADPKAIDLLTSKGDNDVAGYRVNVKFWQSLRFVGDVWRFRILDTSATSYRIVYGYNWQLRQLCVLAILHKDQLDYDDHDNELTKRIIEDWRSL